ncbi:MAG: carboxypeptidase regulatory-like domain-containing protein, partial [Planctomycetes bacterium]|nr:carboxypeptidase regulatory-like domain-containing protein [Planctomycetota bacterium]
APSRLERIALTMAEREGGEPRTEVALRLVLREPFGRLSGNILDQDDQPIEGALVQVCPDYNPRASNPPPRYPATMWTGADGHFSFDCLTAAPSTLWVAAAGFAPQSMKIDIDSSSVAQVHLGPGAQISGIVTDQDGQPIADVTIHSGRIWGFEYVGTTTDATGRFELLRLPTGALPITVSKEGAGKLTHDVLLDAGTSLVWNPVLDLGLTVRGRVLDAEGQGLAGRFVTAVGPRHESGDETRYGEATTDADGRFLIGNLPDKPFALGVFSSDRSGVDAAVLDRRAGPGEVVIRLADQGFGRLVGEVVGTPEDRRDFRILVISQVEGRRTVPIDAATGRFEVERVFPGPCEVLLKGPQRSIVIKSHDFQRFETLDLGVIQIPDFMRKGPTPSGK